jgi:predicted HicB family RNase H-like nuclease
MSKQPVAASLTSIPLEPVEEGQATLRHIEADGPPPRPGTAALTLRIDPVLHRDLRNEAHRRDTTIQNIILEALRKHGFKSAMPDGR